jgi:catechol-2,3-dioxygenase
MHIHELRLGTHLLEQQRAFYTGVLGLPLQAQSGDQFALTVGASTLTFTADPSPERSVCHFAFNIPHQHFAAAKRWLAGRVPLVADPAGADEFHFADWNAQAVYFADPAGNLCELIARRDLPDQPPPLSGAGLLSISEIGLVVDDVPEFVRAIQRELGSPVYRGAVNDLFVPVGDERGLLIVVKRGRLWFPEQTLAAAPAPVTAIVSETGAKRYRLEGPPYRLTPEVG